LLVQSQPANVEYFSMNVSTHTHTQFDFSREIYTFPFQNRLNCSLVKAVSYVIIVID
jgi:hypothetical protein